MASDFQLRRACHYLRRGGVIVYPTDTIYGLGCDPRNIAAHRRLFDVKHRPQNKSVILLAATRQQLAPYCDASVITGDNDKPTSWILPAALTCPPWLQAADGTVAVRITSHPLVAQLCAGIDSALVSTSANISGHRPACDTVRRHRFFHDRVDAILVDDRYSTWQASRIINLATGTAIRN